MRWNKGRETEKEQERQRERRRRRGRFQTQKKNNNKWISSDLEKAVGTLATASYLDARQCRALPCGAAPPCPFVTPPCMARERFPPLRPPPRPLDDVFLRPRFVGTISMPIALTHARIGGMLKNHNTSWRIVTAAENASHARLPTPLFPAPATRLPTPFAATPAPGPKKRKTKRVSKGPQM